MKKRAGLVFCLLVLTVASVCAGFLFGFTAGVEENKNELFSSLAQKVAPAADSKLFVRLFGKSDEGESEEPRLKTLFGSVRLSAGESFKNASFYPAELSLNAKDMKLNAASSDESVASASVLSCDENSVRVEITAKASGKAEVFLVDESGAVSSERIQVSVAAVAPSAEPTEGETNAPSPAESEESEETVSTVPETSTEPETSATEKETAEGTTAEKTKKAAEESTEKVTENKKEKERKAQAAQEKTTEKKTESETKKETKRPAATAGAKENGSLVYKTPSGSCYHRASCRYIKSGATSLTVKEAESRGLRACKVCKP